MTQTYTPRPDSLAAQVIHFFQGNPEEKLTLEDITVKWDASRGNIHTLLARAVEERILLREKDVDGAYLYAAGPATGNAAPAAPRAKPAPKGYTSTRHMVDFSALKVEEGIPFTPGGARGCSKWDPLFDKLTKAGQSIAIPGEYRGAVAAAAMKLKKEKRGEFRVQMTGPGQARVWRLA